MKQKNDIVHQQRNKYPRSGMITAENFEYPWSGMSTVENIGTSTVDEKFDLDTTEMKIKSSGTEPDWSQKKNLG